MLLLVDQGSDEPLFSQIAGEVRKQIATGEVGAGTRLPSARLLADQLGINVHTVLKGYQMLLGSCVDFGQRFDGFSYAASVDCW